MTGNSGGHLSARQAARVALDAAAAAGVQLSVWVRDDDAVTTSPRLDRLLALLEEYEVPPALAVVPGFADHRLANRLSRESGIRVLVHGWRHVDHAAGNRRSELGDERPQEQVLIDIRRGVDRIGNLFGPQACPILVPPWNRIAAPVIEQLAGIGVKGLSVLSPPGPRPLRDGLVEINVHVDVMLMEQSIARVFAGALGQYKGQEPFVLPMIGIMTHHRNQDEEAWVRLRDILEEIQSHPAGRFVSPDNWLVSSG